MVEKQTGFGNEGWRLVRASESLPWKEVIGQWTPIHDIFARSWVINGAVTQERFHKFRWVQKRISAKSVADVELKNIVCTCAKDGTTSGWKWKAKLGTLKR